MNTFINDKIASFTHDALLIFQQFPNVSALMFNVENVELENMPEKSKDELANKVYTHSQLNILPGKHLFIYFNSVPTI